MAIVITDEGATIKIVNGTRELYVSKTGASVSSNGNSVYINAYEVDDYRIKHSEVSSPVTESASALAAILEGYLETGSDSPDLATNVFAI